MRLVISTGLGVDRPEDYAALKQYLMANLPGKPTELVTANPQSCDTLVNQLAAEFNIPVVRRVIEWTENTVALAKLMVGDMITYASEKPGSAMVVVCHKPSELMLHARTVCQTYELPIHLVHVPATRFDNGTDQQVAAARDVTAVSTVTRAPQQQNEPYIFPQSFSSLQVFETCPRQYEAKYITREVKFQQSAAAAWGDKAHMALEAYVLSSGTAQLPQEMTVYQRYGDWLLNRAAQRGGQILVERKAAVTRDLQSTSYGAKGEKRAWIQGKIDVTVLYPHLREAEVFDWKTNEKIKNDVTQLKLYNGFALTDFQNIDVVRSGYVWLKHDQVSPPQVTSREELPAVWGVFDHKYNQLRDAYVRGVFPPKPNGLCGWCDVVSCPHNTKDRRRR